MLHTSAWKATLVNGNNARPSLWHLLELLGFCIDHITPKSPNESMRTTKFCLCWSGTWSSSKGFLWQTIAWRLMRTTQKKGKHWKTQPLFFIAKTWFFARCKSQESDANLSCAHSNKILNGSWKHKWEIWDRFEEPFCCFSWNHHDLHHHNPSRTRFPSRWCYDPLHLSNILCLRYPNRV